MSADFSRIRHNPLLDWAGIELKQGGVLLDADANELVAVLDRRLRALASDVLGRGTVSQTTPEAFQLTVVAGMLNIGRGRLYVDGLLAECHGAGAPQWDTLLAEARGATPVRYDQQPYLPQPPALPTAGRHLVYLDVWQREVTHIERPELVEIAVGVETSSRLQTVWQVRVLAPEAGNATCASPDGDVAGWAALIAPSDGRLTTGTFEVPPLNDPCQLPPSGGYRGVENHLYRVEIHDAGTAGGGATFKFSRENASICSGVSSVISATELELQTLGRDDVLSFKDGDWVEISDDIREFSQRAGEMRRISVDVANRRISFAPALPAAMLPAAFPDSVFPGTRHLRVKRWDQRGRVFRTGAGGNTVQVQDLDLPASTGVIDVPGPGTTLLLEDGITVNFSSGANGFKAGDYWVFAARTADTSVEELASAPPRGIHHHYTRLGFWDVAAGTVTDCRTHWPPDAGGGDCSCTECVTPESHASGALTIQAAVDRVRDSGGTVCLHAGTYVLAAPVQVTGARSVTLRGQGPATVLAAPGSAFVFANSAAVLLEKMAIVSLGRDGSAVVLRTVAGARVADMVLAVLASGDFRAAGIGLQGLCAGVAIEDNLVIAPDGIRTEATGEGAPRVVLTAALSIVDNILWCQRQGINFTGAVGHLYAHHISRNQLLGCRDGGIALLGASLLGAAMRVDHNSLNVNGEGIVAGVDGLWIEANKLVAVRQGQRTATGSGIVLRAGLDKNGSDQAQVLANQISGFNGAAVEVLSPVQELVCKLNIIEACDQGIVMNEDAEAGAVSIENNHLTDIQGTAAGDTALVATGIAVARTGSASIVGNTVRRVGLQSARATLTVGVSTVGVGRARVAGNSISEIGPPANLVGIGVGILVRAPYQHAEITHNHVQRDAELALAIDDALWLAVYILETTAAGNVANTGAGLTTGAAVNDNFTNFASSRFVPGADRAGGVSTLRVDGQRTLVFSAGRAFVSVAAGELDAAGAVVARGSAAMVQGNSLFARGRMPALIAMATGDCMVNDNRIELRAGDETTAVLLATPVLVLNANRVRHAGPAVSVVAANAVVAAVGNITTTGGIRVNGAGLPAPFAALNLNG
jgi:hypothetical protein